MAEASLEFAVNDDPIYDGIAVVGCRRSSVAVSVAPGFATGPPGVIGAPVCGARADEHPERRQTASSADHGVDPAGARPPARALRRQQMTRAPETIAPARDCNTADGGGSRGARAIRDVCEGPRRALRWPKERETHPQEQTQTRHAGRRMRVATRNGRGLDTVARSLRKRARPACPTGPIRGEARP
jgi:hypothetical protein